jgi:SAM-dependent methyltransferase
MCQESSRHNQQDVFAHMPSNALIEDQYRDSAKLAARINLHRKYGAKGGVAGVPAEVTPAPGASVLEVGCGPGRIWRELARSWPTDLSVTLTDLSPGMVEEGLQAVRSLGHWKRVAGQVADVCALPFADASFDVVLAMHMLYHAPDRNLAAAEIARVLRPGGIAIASTNGEDNLAALFELGHAALGGERLDRMAAVFSLDSGPPILRRCFADVEVRRSTDVLRVTDPADVVAYLTSFAPGDRAGPAALARLRSMTDQALAAGAGVFEITRDTGFLIARKAA